MVERFGWRGLATVQLCVALAVSVLPAPPIAGAAEVSWVARENAKPGTWDWRIPDDRVATNGELSAYANRTSVARGRSFRLYASTAARGFTVRAYRMGWYGGKGGREVWRSGFVRGRQQRAPTVSRWTRTVRTRWRRSLTVPTSGWPEGSYVLKLTTTSGRQRYVPITVRSRSAMGDVAIMNGVTTWQAYNDWGGYSLYRGADGSFARRSYKVTFDRPYNGTGANLFFFFEHGPIMRAERLGLRLAYLTSVDLHRRPELLNGARGLVSLGHDEYWTRGMKLRVERRRDRGLNIAFLGANALYWRIRFQKSRLGAARTIVAYKSASLDPMLGVDNANVTVRFRDYPAPSPEDSLVGMRYNCFPAEGPMVISDPSFFLFRNTGVERGTRFHGLASIEVDWAQRTATAPRNLRVVTHNPVSCGGSPSYANSTYYTAGRGGGGVFATGTMVWATTLKTPWDRFGISMRSVRFVRRVTDNLLRAMAAGPLGTTHPSGGGGAFAGAGSASGLSPGPVPPRLQGDTKERLLKLIDDTVTDG